MKFKTTLHKQVRYHLTITTLKVTVCHTAGHYGEEYDSTTTGIVTSSGRGGTAAAMAQNEQLSMLQTYARLKYMSLLCHIAYKIHIPHEK